jgi:hypothetical protein
MNDQLKIGPPLYLTGKNIRCWRRSSKMPVVALLAPQVEGTDNEICVLSNIQEPPEDVLSYIRKRAPTFKVKFSKTVREKYFANTCPACGVLSGDFFLHSEPGAPFFPTTENEAKNLFITEIPLSNEIKVSASCGMGVGALILSHAKKI